MDLLRVWLNTTTDLRNRRLATQLRWTPSFRASGGRILSGSFNRATARSVGLKVNSLQTAAIE